MFSIFSCAYWPFVLSLEKCWFKFFPHFKIIFLLLSFKNFFKDFFIPERESMSVLTHMGAGRGAEGKGERQIPRRSQSLTGLHLMTLRSWPERKWRVRCSTDWATQVPLKNFFNMFWTLDFCQIHDLQIFSPILCIVFSLFFFDRDLCSTEVFISMKSNLSKFFS